MPIPPFLKALIISTFLLAQLAAAAELSLELGQPTYNPNSNLASLVQNQPLGQPTHNAISNLVSLLHNQPHSQRLSSDAQEYLNAHNNIRHKKGVPPLQWDEKLAQYAQRWAEQGVNECNPHHHSDGPYGENNLWEQYDERTPTEVTQVWIDEEVNYDHVKLACKCQTETLKCMCGHYTQLVWSATKAVGCGNVTCNNELGFLIVCSYNPPGNYQDENPFQNAHSLPSTVGAHRAHRKHHHHRPSGALTAH
ncbi:pathogenesis-related protein 1A-like [Rhododendron vialii]|uniref:pathogenesis-related protein 1A-like n=1 Tax=Rhododendron vialii TaxID=182163 RepID=UPI00265DA3F6|nr:pathogenesis-related protein 1A-like [Rhododendron vialii]